MSIKKAFSKKDIDQLTDSLFARLKQTLPSDKFSEDDTLLIANHVSSIISDDLCWHESETKPHYSTPSEETGGL